MFASLARLFALACLLSACSTSKGPVLEPEKTGATGLTLQIHAAAGLNPGAGGQPAPVRVRIFELRNSAAFARADYFALAERAAQVLGADLVDQDEVLVRPGETRSVTRPLDPATRQVGLVVGYREIDRALWRSVLAVQPGEGGAYRIDLDAQAVRSERIAPQNRPAQ